VRIAEKMSAVLVSYSKPDYRYFWLGWRSGSQSWFAAADSDFQLLRFKRGMQK
jgi:hypothetical protein